MNVDGTQQVKKALTKIPGIGMRISHAILSRLGIDMRRRAGDLSVEEIKSIQDGIQDPASLGIPDYFLNHPKDMHEGTTSHLVGTKLDADLRMLIEKGKKIRHVRLCRLAVGLKVRGQRTKANGRHGKVVGVSRKK